MPQRGLVVIIAVLTCFAEGVRNSLLDTRPLRHSALINLRGGGPAQASPIGLSDAKRNAKDDDVSESEEVEAEPSYNPEIVAWLWEQCGLYQQRLALLSSPIHDSGYAVQTVIPKPQGLISAKSTAEHPLRCRVYMEPEEGSKVVAPCRCKGTQRWIAVRALNQQRRKEPQKWERCPTCQAPIDYTLYEKQMKGTDRLATLILNHRRAARTALAIIISVGTILTALQLQWLIVRILVSEFVWKNYSLINRVVELPLPLKILGVQWARKRLAESFSQLEEAMRERLTELESSIMERTLEETMTAEEAEATIGSDQ